MEKKTVFVNFFGGPGVGKTTLASGLYTTLNFRGCNAHIVGEFAKECVLTGNLRALQDQVYVSGTQRHRILSMDGLYDVVVTDSPYILGRFYGKKEPAFLDFLLEDFRRRRNLNVLIERSIPYEQIGRVEDAEKARKVDGEIREFFRESGLPFVRVRHEQRMTLDYLADLVVERIRSEQQECAPERTL